MSENACGRYRAWLTGFADGDLEDELLREVEAHVTRCSSCLTRVEELRQSRPVFGKVSMPEEFWRPREEALARAFEPKRPWWRRLAGALLGPLPVPRVVAFAAVVALIWLAGRDATPVPVERPVAPAAAPAPRPLLDVEGLARPAADVG